MSWSTFNQTVCALRFLYRTTLGRPEQLPHDSLRQAAQDAAVRAQPRGGGCACSTPPRRAATACCADRLRLRPAAAAKLLHLQVGDIDSARMVVHVRQGKGRKDRLVPLSLRLLQELRAYWRQYRPRDLAVSRPARRTAPLTPARCSAVSARWSSRPA